MDQNPPIQTATNPCDKSHKEPTLHTIAANQKVLQDLQIPFQNKEDFDAAHFGYIGTMTATPGAFTDAPDVYTVRIASDTPGPAVWNLAEYSFLTPPPPPPLKDVPAPNSVNPSLWRQAKINMNNGLFHVKSRTYSLNGRTVTRGIYQVRAFDLSNMTIVEGDTGIIVIDPLISTECARASLQLFRHFRPQAGPVKAVIYTHSHIDHYGGVNGVVNKNDVGNGTNQIPILAPDGFLDHAISENAFAGNAMGRRAVYMYGAFLHKNAKGRVDGGLGKGVSTGDSGLIPPTIQIQKSLEPRPPIDGVNITFMLAQDTEAPSEMLFYFPQFKALCAAEDMTHNLHNLYSIRGSQVRNAMAWWKVINEVIKLWGTDMEVIFAQHHWPMWKAQNSDNLRHYLKKQRDLYKYILDQSLRLLNHGRTMVELAEMISMPDSLAHEWYNRGYYGTLNHDSKAVYQRYLGWYDANPANLHPHPPVKASRKYLEYMGGAETVLARAHADYDLGDYRWVAEVLNHVIFADPDGSNPDPPDPIIARAKCLQADALEQMGYQAESGPWRNAYLTGADELRNGPSSHLPDKAPLSASVISAMTLDQYFDYMGLRFNAPKAEQAQLAPTTINWIVGDPMAGANYYYHMEYLDYTLPYTSYDNGVLPSALIRVTLKRDVLNNLARIENPGEVFLALVDNGTIQVEGDKLKVAAIFDMLDMFPGNFNIVTPRQEQDLP